MSGKKYQDRWEASDWPDLECRFSSDRQAMEYRAPDGVTCFVTLEEVIPDAGHIRRLIDERMVVARADADPEYDTSTIKAAPSVFGIESTTLATYRATTSSPDDAVRAMLEKACEADRTHYAPEPICDTGCEACTAYEAGRAAAHPSTPIDCPGCGLTALLSVNRDWIRCPTCAYVEYGPDLAKCYPGPGPDPTEASKPKPPPVKPVLTKPKPCTCGSAKACGALPGSALHDPDCPARQAP